MFIEYIWSNLISPGKDDAGRYCVEGGRRATLTVATNEGKKDFSVLLELYNTR